MLPPGGESSFFHPSLTQRRQLILSATSVSAVVAGMLMVYHRAVFSERYMPHAFCYLEKPGLVWTHVIADTLIGLSYMAISASLAYLVIKGRREIPFRWMFVAFGLFIVACGWTHFIETLTVWVPVYVFSAGVKVFTAVASVCTAAALPFMIPRSLNLIREAKESEKRQQELELVLEQRNDAQAELRSANVRLEELVRVRTAQLEKANSDLHSELEQRKQLQTSIGRLAAIVESSQDAILAKDLSGVVTAWNRGAERLYGYSAQEVIGRHVSFIVPPQRRGEIDEIMRTVTRGESMEPYTTERINKAGAILQVSLTASPVFDDQGQIVGASAIARDISAAIRAEEQLRESEKQYRLMFNSNPLPMWIFDRQSLRFLAVNQAAVRQYGYSREEFFRMTILDIRPPEDVPAVVQKVATPMVGMQEKEIWRHRKKDGSIIDVDVTACALKVPTPDSVLVLAHDVTERVENERKLRQSEERFSKAFRSSPFGITISSEAEGRYIDANPAFLQAMGYERDELVNHTSLELNVWCDPGERQLILERLNRSGADKGAEVRFRTKAGQIRRVEVTPERIRLGDESCILSTNHDVTEQRQLEQQFLQAQKMEAVGRLAGGIAHDFNNMLGVIIGYAELAQHQGPGEYARVQKYLEAIQKTGKSAATLVRQLLVFSSQQQQVKRVLNLNAVIENISNMLRHMIGEDITLNFRPMEPLGSVQVDLGQMEQVLMNLAVNARDAMPKGGELLIESFNVDLDEAYIGQQGPVKAGSYVMLAVSDSGVGMDQDTMRRIFEPFFTTKEPGKGTGLGLATVWGIVKQSGGYVSVYSEPGHGTTFKIYLPRVDQMAESLIPANVKVVPPSGHETVLVVEDDNELRALAVTVLQEKGYNVLSASNGAMALEFAQQFPGEISLLLTDVIMPGMSGPELVTEIQKRRPGMKALFMSGYAKNLIVEEGVLSKESAMLTKPFSSVELLMKVRSVLEG